MSHLVEYKGHTIYCDSSGLYYIDSGDSNRYINFNEAKKEVDRMEQDAGENFVDLKHINNGHNNKRES